MPLPDKKQPLIVLLGPTAVGKTELSLQLAEELDAEIISADSRLLYRGMDIGTAKPSRHERERVPHHLIDVANPDEIWSLAQFQRGVYAAVDAIHQHGKIPFLVGGTGQYISAIVEGWLIPEVKPDARLRAALQNWGAQIGSLALHDRLAYLDPAAAAQIQPQNMRRTIRALEVILHTGTLFSSQKQQSGGRYRPLRIGITRPRPALYARIDQRIETMFADGLVAEVEALLAAGYDPNLPSLSAIGYRQVVAYLQGEISLEEVKVQMRRITRQFVRRQANWFKPSDPTIQWFSVSDTLFDEVIAAIRLFLAQD